MPRENPPHHKVDNHWLPEDNSNDFDQEIFSPINFLRNLFTSHEQYLPEENILRKLAPIWAKNIVPELRRKFKRNTTLYAIFYVGQADELIIEIWDPNYVNKKSSEVFKLKGCSKNEVAPFAKDRSQTNIISLQNWEQPFRYSS